MEQEDGIMQAVRELLAQGMSSREVIEKGYAPGTVYKVQRQLRRGSCEALPPEPAAHEEPEQGFMNEVRRLQEENSRLEQAALWQRTLQQHEAESLQRQASDLSFELEASRRDRVELETRLTGMVRESLRVAQESDRLSRALEETRSQNATLRGYLFSKSCGWQRDFAIYLERRNRAPLPMCTYGVRSKPTT
jgi:exonuclease VII large subunit